MGSAFADPPAAGVFVDDPETVSAGGFRMPLANVGRNSGTFVAHFDEQAFPVELDADLDSPASVHDCVGHELAHQQRGRLAHTIVELLAERLDQPAARNARRLDSARQLEHQRGAHDRSDGALAPGE